MNLSEKIEKLNRNNYDTWSIIMESVLKSRKLWDLVKLEIDLDSPEADDQAKILLDVTKNEEAKAILYTAMDREEIQKTGVCESASDLWFKIKENHQGADVDQRNISLSDFLSYSYKRGESITSYCGRFEVALAKAEASGLHIDESTKFWVFRNTLPGDIKTMANFWMMANPTGKIAGLITCIKLQYHLDKKEKQESNSAFFGEGSKPPQKYENRNQSNQNRVPYCKFCSRKGHLIKDCRKKAAKEQQDNARNQANNKKTAPNAAKKFAFNVYEKEHKTIKPIWIVDSGASSHMTPDKSILSNYEELSVPRSIIFGDGKESLAVGKGKFEFRSGKFEGELREVLWVPDLYENLFSVGKTIANGNQVEFKGNEVVFTKGGLTVLRGRKSDSGLFTIRLQPSKTRSVEHAAATLEEWHKRYGHSSIEAVKKLAKTGAVHGLNLKTDEKDKCEDCFKGKQTRTTHPSRSCIKASEDAAVLHIDTCGPISTESLGGSKYFVLAVEEFSNYKLIDFVKNKSEIADVVKRMISRVELESRRPVKMIQTDNGTEFINSNLENFLLDKGILHEKVATYTPEQNGSVERANRTIIQGIRTLLSDSKLPEELWAEAAGSIVYTTNRLLSPRCKDKTRFELYWQRKPDVSNLQPFGKQALTLIPKPKRDGKLAEKSKTCFMVGYTERSNTYRLYDPENGSILISCDVKFMGVNNSHELEPEKENEIMILEPVESSSDKSAERTETSLNDASCSSNGSQENLSPVEQTEAPSEDEFLSVIDENESPTDANVEVSSLDGTEIYDCSGNLVESEETEPTDGSTLTEEPEQSSTPRNDKSDNVNRRATRSTVGPDDLVKPNDIKPWFWNYTEHALVTGCTLEDEPRTLKEAMDSEQWLKWKAAMDDEMHALEKNKTWQLVDRPLKKRTIKSKWVFKIKTGPDGTIDRYKARLVAKGYYQIPNVDYKETFAPVASAITIRIVFALATQFEMELMQFDVKTAFLYGDLNETIYMDYPEGYENPDNKVCHLIKSLYGLKQAPRQWNIKFNDFLTEFKLKRSNVDKCLYFNSDRTLILAIYVDDGLVASSDKGLLTKLVAHLRANFEVKVMACESYLGFRIHRNHKQKEMIINQSLYAQKVLTRFGMNDCKPVSTPEEMGPLEVKDTTPLPDNYPFKDLVGSLLYLVTCTRPDIAHAVSVASRTGSPTMEHWLRLKRILRYLKGTIDMGIRFRWEKQPELIGYSDSDYANDVETRRSTTGFVILYGGAPIAWRCQRQSIVTLSTTEAEYVSGCEMVKELLPIRETLIELKAIDEKPTQVRIDNLSTVRIAKDDGGQKRTKHIDVRAKWLNEHEERNIIDVVHVNGSDQAADILTKPLLKTKFQKNRAMLLTTLMMISLLNVVLSDPFLKVEPIDFARTSHVLLNKAEVWYTRVHFPNICRLFGAQPTNQPLSETQQWYDACTENFERIMNEISECRGVLTDFKLMQPPKIVYPDRAEDLELSRPYFITVKGDTLITLTEPSGAKMDEKAKTQEINNVYDEIKEYWLGQLAKARNTTLNKSDSELKLRTEVIKGPYEKLREVTKHLNDALKLRTLTAAFPIWSDQPFSYESEAKRATYFNCSQTLDMKGATVDLHFAATKPDKTIEFFEATSFDFYNTTNKDENGRNTTCWMTYHGPKYIMVNTTNQCMTEVSVKTLGDFSTEVQMCENPTENLKLYASRMWHKEFCTTKILPQKEKIQIKYLNKVVRIYCFPFNVTIGNDTKPCPDYVFEEDSGTIHRIADMEVHGSNKPTNMSSEDHHYIRKMKNFLKIDEIRIGAQKMVTDIYRNVANTTVDIISNFPGKVGNLTSSITSSIGNVASDVKTKITSGVSDAIDKIWTYIEYAGVVLCVLAGGVLLLLAAPLVEVIFFIIKLIKIPYRQSAASFSRVLSKLNNKATKTTSSYLLKARSRFDAERVKLLDRRRVSKMV